MNKRGAHLKNVFLVVAVALFFVFAVSATQNVWNGWSAFSAGSNVSLFYNTTINALQLNANTLSGNYTSQVYNTNYAQFNNISWTQGAPYQQPLPNSKAVESSLGGMNMSGNILLMHFEEASGNAVDSSGDGRTLTVSPTVLYSQTGVVGKAIDFNGGGYFTTPVGAFNFTNNPFTFMAWLYPKDVGVSGKLLLYTRSTSGYGIFFGPGGSDRRLNVVSYPSFVTQYSTSNVSLNKWTHIAVIYNPSLSIEFYINGRLDVSRAIAYNFSASDLTNVIIGGKLYSSPFYFNGSMDELAVFNRSLSATEIANAYKRGAFALNLSVMSCDDAACSGESLTNLGSNLTSPQTLSVANNSYFQYQFKFSALNESFSPELYNVTLDYTLLDSTPPSISLNAPANNSNISYSNIYFNFTGADNLATTLNCSLYIDSVLRAQNASTLNGTLTNLNYSGLSDGNHLWNVSCLDTGNNANTSETRAFRLDASNPLVDFGTGTENNGTAFARDWIFVNVSVIEANEANITFNLYNVTGEVNTTTLSAGNRIINWTGLSEKDYYYNVTVNDYFGHSNTTSLRKITLDMTNPLISFGTNTLNSGTNVSQANVYVNVSVTETNEGVVVFKLYNLTGEVNTTTLSAGNRTINWTGLQNGTYYYNVTVNDTAGNTNSTSTYTITLDTGNPNATLLTPGNATYNSSNQNFSANITDNLGIKNATLNIVNSSGSTVNQTTFLGGAVQEVVGIVVDLIDGIYNWFFDIFDWAGNRFATENRTLTMDKTNPLISFDATTAANNTNASRAWIFVNVSVVETNTKNITFRLYNSSMALVNSTTYSMATQTANNTINFTSLSDGVYYYNVTVYDLADNGNSTETRKITLDITAPTLLNYDSDYYSPNTADTLDPGVTMTLTSRVQDSGVGTSTVILEFYNGTSWTNHSMSRTSGTIYSGVYSASVVLNSVDSNYTYVIWANDSVGNVKNTTNQTFSANWDCTWSITPTDLGTTGGLYQTKTLGNITLNNTGDVLYGNNNCSITFNNWLSYTNFSSSYWGQTTWPSPGARGMKFYNAGSEITSIILNATNSTVLEPYGIFPNAQGVIQEYPYFVIKSSIADSETAAVNKTINAKMTISPGAYLEQVIDSYPSAINLTTQNINLSAYVKNVVDGADGANNTAYDVYFNWTLPSYLSSGLISGNLTNNYSMLNDTTKRDQDIEIALTSSNIPSIPPGTPVTITAYAWGYENSSGNLTLINSSGTSTLFSSEKTIYFSCYSVLDGIPVPLCGAADGDYVASTGGTTTGGSSGSSGGGGSAPSAVLSAADFQLVRGKQNEIKVPFKNRDGNLTLKNLKISVSGKIEKYIELSPTEISELLPGETIDFTLRITSPTYISLGRQELTLYIKGKKGVEDYNEYKKVTIEIQEISTGDARALVNESEVLIEKLRAANLSSSYLENLLNETQTALAGFDYEKVISNSDAIKKQVGYALDSKKILDELDSFISLTNEKGIATLNSERIVKLAKLSLQRAEFEQAYARAKEAQVAYALEIKGEIGKLSYYLKNNPMEISLGAVFLVIFSFSSYKLTRLQVIKNKLAKLKEEESILTELMKVIQRETFKENRMSIEEYKEAMLQYEKKLAKVIEEIIDLETQRAYVLKFASSIKELKVERARIVDLIKEIQTDYLKKGKMETRAYELRLESYNKKISEIDQKLATGEAQKALKGGFSKLISLNN